MRNPEGVESFFIFYSTKDTETVNSAKTQLILCALAPLWLQ